MNNLENNHWFKKPVGKPHGENRRGLTPGVYQSESGISTPITLPDIYKEPPHKFPGLDVAQSSTGVIWTTERAAEMGFTYEDPSKCFIVNCFQKYLKLKT